MFTYHKIQSIYKRDENTKHKYFIEGVYSTKEIEYLAYSLWEGTEKVDGTNIRVIYDPSYGDWQFKGKTDKAEIPVFLYDKLREIFEPVLDIVKGQFNIPVCFYGEGYGPKIQKVGNNYRKDCSFVLFDIYTAGYWLKRNDIETLASELKIDVVPIVYYGNLLDAVDLCKTGFKSKWGDFTAEGLVLVPHVPLFDRMGNRIITKIKYKDFNKGEY